MNKTVAVVGLGYVGLPLAHALAKNGYETIGFDINQGRIDELNGGHDHTNELSNEQLAEIWRTQGMQAWSYKNHFRPET